MKKEQRNLTYSGHKYLDKYHITYYMVFIKVTRGTRLGMI